ncbi:MAG: tRNA (N6-threonylcarbamoyladenosine(37)-N6)-methyltransferase TrmO [Negativicutes bacterium]|nr:tRNA (N6-threonylcarbamoyladenosine(37)-N6)-methyltransferase TrmO [Negativicutes bacterium]
MGLAADETAQTPLKIIAHIRSDFSGKFGVPRQSGLVETLQSEIIFVPKYRNPDTCRGLADFSHLWLIWQFSQNVRTQWSATVRPPRLGGNRRMGVFATRSPFRPNALGLSSVKLDCVEWHSTLGPILHVLGADLIDQTPIYDIKPYLSYTDSHPEARGGFSDPVQADQLTVKFADALLQLVPEQQRQALIAILAADPRPSYQSDPQRIYAFEFAQMHVEFMVKENLLEVCRISLLRS